MAPISPNSCLDNLARLLRLHERAGNLLLELAFEEIRQRYVLDKRTTRAKKADARAEDLGHRSGRMAAEMLHGSNFIPHLLSTKDGPSPELRSER
ncbi:hypothetical protein LOZ65_003838 [Ophidiomyces ophidiicola]|nr:hypothetical protein LOZ65_003838 [Ophidiomyces ophidiicola]